MTFPDIKLPINGKFHSIGVTIDYLKEEEFSGLLLVTFKDHGEIKKRKDKLNSPAESQLVTELEKDLEFTKLQLHNTIEQMESSVEELKSTNEELQSTNEELQSTNEEALTTKEEMQSLNEELMTINLQYHNKAEELTRLNNDMKNLLDNTEIGTIFLDNNLNILRFTPQVTKLFNVIPQDVGRSITHIVSNFDYPSIENAILDVIERLVGRELEVKTKKDEWYNLRIMPYRTTDNFINGAVLAFTKITPLKSLEVKLNTLVSYVQTVVDGLKTAAVIIDKEQRILVVNKAFLRLFHLKESEVKEQFLMGIVINRWHADSLMKRLNDATEIDEYYFEHTFPELGLKRLMVKVQQVSKSGFKEHTASIITFEELAIGHEKQ
jgi:two-component system CheB/CheR fusion protein